MTLLKTNTGLMPFTGFFDDFFRRDLADWGFQNHSATQTTLPAVNIVESHDGFVVEMAAPGMHKEDFKIELENETLKIMSERRDTREMKEEERYTRREFSYMAFERTFRLPKSVVDDSKIIAKYEDGILKIQIPKREEARTRPPRMIEIK